MGLRDVQVKLAQKGYNPGPVDGLWGPRTEAAILAAIEAAPARLQPTEQPLTQRELDMHPELLRRWLQAKAAWNKKRPDREVFCTCSYRSPAEQEALYAQGRTRPGPIVTNAMAGQSIHNYLPALALDVAFLRPDGTLDWTDSLFQEFAAVFKPLGVEWGGDWPKFRDMPHFQAPGVRWQDLQAGRKYVWGQA